MFPESSKVDPLHVQIVWQEVAFDSTRDQKQVLSKPHGLSAYSGQR
jgi:hypothetical protein